MKLFKRFILILVFSLGLFIVPVLASDLTQWTTECEQRNIFQGCQCDCDSPKKDASGIAVIKRFDANSDGTISPVIEEPYVFARCEANTKSKECSQETWFSRAVNSPGDIILTGKLFNPDDVVGRTKDNNPLNPFPNFEKGLISTLGDGRIDLDVTVRNFIQLILLLVVIVAIFIIFYGYYVLASAQDNEENQEKGRNIMRNSFFGVVIAVLSYVIVFLIISITGFGNNEQFSINYLIYGPSYNDNLPDNFEDIKSICALQGKTCEQVCTEILAERGVENDLDKNDDGTNDSVDDAPGGGVGPDGLAGGKFNNPFSCDRLVPELN